MIGWIFSFSLWGFFFSSSRMSPSSEWVLAETSRTQLVLGLVMGVAVVKKRGMESQESGPLGQFCRVSHRRQEHPACPALAQA